MPKPWSSCCWRPGCRRWWRPAGVWRAWRPTGRAATLMEERGSGGHGGSWKGSSRLRGVDRSSSDLDGGEGPGRIRAPAPSGKELLPGSPNCSRSCDVKHEETAEEESDDDTCADFYYCYSRAANRLLDDEKHEIIGLASIQPGNPAFMTVLLRSHLQRKDNFLVIPSEFVDEHLHMRSHEVVLLRPNREERWHVSYYHQGSSSRGFRGQPWAKFVSNNKLHKGDICVFELIKGARNEKKARTTMTVHVVRRKKSEV
ncbi:B3 domain-containing protein Os12g0592300-like isoform X2 [Triticum dicoccoides]|uniref:B3 domain-containing protein Os12g0592300-like isoform X2 n=1 Tax=Triticum dicoccoides TaxID=85692 RepID=UPI00188DECE7|nr:B3 domain-containing protein Os12g0592300-like isoform X2 [Triticum dicoccoides]